MFPREQNSIANTLSSTAVNFKIPIHPNKKYEIVVKKIPSILDNATSWKFFDDDVHIFRLLNIPGHF